MKKLLLIVLSALLLCSVLPAADVVNIDSGPIIGTDADGLRIYLGIPYAAPPIGPLRWRPPQAVQAWTGVKECAAYGSSCPQPESIKIGITSEDCLYLNVWTPAKTDGDKLPVMVWIHGGGWSLGSGSMPMFNGAKLAKKGVVFVNFNYRLGPFGFFVHPQLCKESPYGVSGNYGLMDQIAALKWVKNNISAFGGDSENITIFGESSGSMSVSLHMISPLSTGLFNRGISQSGAPYGLGYIFPQADGQMQKAIIEGQKLTAVLGCDKAADPIAALRSVSSEAIIAAYPFDLTPFSPGMKFAPVIDGYVIPDDPEKMYMQGKNLDVPLIIGSNSDEGTAFYQTMTVSEYRNWIALQFGKHVDEVFAMFPAKTDADVRSAFNRLSSVMIFSEPSRFAARSREGKTSRTFFYHFTRVSPTELGKAMGATHGTDLLYVFGNTDKSFGFTGTDARLSQNMMDYWVNFAKTGDPNSSGLPLWPVYSRTGDENIEFGDQIRVNKNLLKKECDLIRSIRQY
ncbi:MAG: carboxylesterase/lipase family protein [Candidatus Margulisiibacteriota bacterium]